MTTTSHGQAADETHASASHWVGLPDRVSHMPFAANAEELQGTVAANLGEGNSQTYTYASEALIRGRPVQGSIVPSPVRSPQKVSAKDMVAELDSINAQIHRIMFQVERAVARLATSG